MMFFLLRNVAHHRRKVSRPHRERRVAGLPGEPGLTQHLMDPETGAALDLPNHVGKGSCGTQPHQHMHVVLDATDDVGVAIESSKGSADVFVQSGAPQFFNQPLTILRGEDNVVVKTEVG